MKYKLLISTLILIGSFSQAFASEAPRSLEQDSRIKVVPYEENNVVPIHATTFITTQISFSKGEYILDIENGDTAAWTADIQKQVPNMLFLKPTILGSDTNMTVVTNQHTYYFHLVSNKNNSSKPNEQTYAVQFIYPEQEKAKLTQQLAFQEQQHKALLNASKNPSAYNWAYSFNGDKRIVPLHVFDDGRFTYMQLQPDQEVPAVFAVDNKKGEEAIVNFRRDGQFLVIQQIAPQFTLRDGKNIVASIFNDNMIARLKHTGVA